MIKGARTSRAGQPAARREASPSPGRSTLGGVSRINGAVRQTDELVTWPLTSAARMAVSEPPTLPASALSYPSSQDSAHGGRDRKIGVDWHPYSKVLLKTRQRAGE